jgi:Mce-associated membrane protein
MTTTSDTAGPVPDHPSEPAEDRPEQDRPEQDQGDKDRPEQDRPEDGACGTEAERRPGRRRWLAALAILAGLAIGAAVSHTTAPDDGTGAATTGEDQARAALTGEVSATLGAVLSYGPGTVDATGQAADRGFTGVAAAQHRSLIARVKTEAPRQRLTVRTRVTRAAVISMRRDDATLLVFVDQVSSRPGQKQGTAGTALVVTAQKTGGRWLISALTSATKERP